MTCTCNKSNICLLHLKEELTTRLTDPARVRKVAEQSSADQNREYALNVAVRDICSVSVAPAAKSEVRRILQGLLLKERAALIESIRNEVEKLRPSSNVTPRLWEEGYNGALDDVLQALPTGE